MNLKQFEDAIRALVSDDAHTSCSVSTNVGSTGNRYVVWNAYASGEGLEGRLGDVGILAQANSASKCLATFRIELKLDQEPDGPLEDVLGGLEGE